jgi:hypothetical protein
VAALVVGGVSALFMSKTKRDAAAKPADGQRDIAAGEAENQAAAV